MNQLYRFGAGPAFSLLRKLHIYDTLVTRVCGKVAGLLFFPTEELHKEKEEIRRGKKEVKYHCNCLFLTVLSSC